MMTPTVESLALNRVRESFPNLQRRGFRGAVLKIEPEIMPSEINFIPDGWFSEFLPEVFEDGDGMHVFTCVEVEDKHPLSREKMWAYCELWNSLEYYYHYLRLFVFDRYDLNRRELNLGQLYCEGRVQMAMERAGRPKTERPDPAVARPSADDLAASR